jgi:hypothetical protein
MGQRALICDPWLVSDVPADHAALLLDYCQHLSAHVMHAPSDQQRQLARGSGVGAVKRHVGV